MAARNIIGRRMKRSEVIIAVLTCGIAPIEFDVARSPRKTVDELLVIH